jgi:hypothetical protein
MHFVGKQRNYNFEKPKLKVIIFSLISIPLKFTKANLIKILKCNYFKSSKYDKYFFEILKEEV